VSERLVSNPGSASGASAQPVADMVVDRTEQGVFTVDRDVFRDPGIFEREMRDIFHQTWVFLGLASQLPDQHDFLTSWIGLQPVIVARDAQGKLGAFMNTCRHRGATLCRTRTGNARAYVCPYHGWSYASNGKLIGIKDLDTGCYSDAFLQQDHDLVPVPRFEEYRGFLFGCLNAAVHPLEEHLNGARFFLDLLVDQSPEGLELVPGISTYTFRGNWKLQVENGLDAYHLTSTHPSFLQIVARRNSGESAHALKAQDLGNPKQRAGFTFDYGHAALVSPNPTPEVRPLYASIAALRSRVGDERAEWMMHTRNLVMFPNLQVVENASVQMRVIRPLAVDLTEMTSYCLAPKGEPPEMRTLRLRQFEDFFNASGMATPDDTTCYEECQTGYGAQVVQWQQGYSRGLTSVQPGSNHVARGFGFEARTSNWGAASIQDETLFHAAYREWQRLMEQGAAREAAAGSTP
jgi:phenylpropionate dioxygenase-like ring-hydroxylating dioxygenase large terminal subunit